MTQSGTADGLAAAAAAAARSGRGLPPVHLWHPPHCGDIDILIQGDGVWMHEGSPIGRAELVRLFSTILRLDPDGYHLVTPAEKLRIRVEDLPFRAVLMRREGDRLVFTTDVGDEVTADAEHLVTVTLDPATGEPRPALHVRAGLQARIVRAVFYDLVEAAEPVGGRLQLRSGDAVFDLGATA